MLPRGMLQRDFHQTVAGPGIAVFSGMLASTCLAVLFVPFYVVMQRFEEWRGTRKTAKSAAPALRD
jgi:hypothetical protein